MGALLDLAMETVEYALTPKVSAATGGYEKDELNEKSTRSVDPAREHRIAKAITMVAEVLTRRAAYIAGDERDSIISVTVVISTQAGLVTGDLAIPNERWDPWLFLKFLQEQDGQSSV